MNTTIVMVTHWPAYADYAHRIIHPGTGDLSRMSHRDPRLRRCLDAMTLEA